MYQRRCSVAMIPTLPLYAILFTGTVAVLTSSLCDCHIKYVTGRTPTVHIAKGKGTVQRWSSKQPAIEPHS